MPTVLAGATLAEPQEDFAQTYQRHFRFVWRVLARLGVPERDLADAVQDVFLVVYRKLGDFDGRSRVTTWLYGICFRVASQRRRAAGSRLEILASAPDSERVTGDGDEAATRLSHYRRLLALALDSMPLEQRAVFSFYELDGMSGEEIAEHVGVSLATVHSRLRLARQVFRRVVSRAEARNAFADARCGGAS